MAGRVPRGDSGGRYAAYDDHPAVPECGADGKHSGPCGPAQCRGQRRDPPAPRTRRSSPMLRLDPCLRAAWASTGAEPLHHAALHIPTRRDGVVAIVRLRDIAGALHRLAADSAQTLRTTRAAGVGKRHGGCRRSGRSPAPRGAARCSVKLASMAPRTPVVPSVATTSETKGLSGLLLCFMAAHRR
jgi:hypothetical protein